MKNKGKLIIDILMYIAIIILTGYHITDNLVHEILGSLAFILFIIHNILNLKWYKTIFKGKHDAKRNIHIAINVLLLFAMIGTTISGIIMSQSIYQFLNINNMTFIARKLHLLSNSWLLVLVSIHFGLHISAIVNEFKSKIKNTNFEYTIYLLILIFIAFGIYCFISEGILNDMFSINEFKMFNYNENSIIFYMRYLCISLSFVSLTYIIKNLKLKEKIKK